MWWYNKNHWYNNQRSAGSWKIQPPFMQLSNFLWWLPVIGNKNQLGNCIVFTNYWMFPFRLPEFAKEDIQQVELLAFPYGLEKKTNQAWYVMSSSKYCSVNRNANLSKRICMCLYMGAHMHKQDGIIVFFLP